MELFGVPWNFSMGKCVLYFLGGRRDSHKKMV